MREVQWEEDEVPEEVLRRADFVERHEREGLREQRGGERVGGCRAAEEGEEERGEQDLGEESQALGSKFGGGRGGTAAGQRRGIVQQRVINAKVVSVVCSGEMVEEGVLDEFWPVDSVHQDVQYHENREGRRNQLYPRSVEQLGQRREVCKRRGWRRSQCPEHADAVDEGVDFEMNR